MAPRIAPICSMRHCCARAGVWARRAQRMLLVSHHGALLARRFDRLLYVGVDSSADGQLRVLTALTRKFSLGADVDLARVIARCGAALTGADMYALAAEAASAALERRAGEIVAEIGAPCGCGPAGQGRGQVARADSLNRGAGGGGEVMTIGKYFARSTASRVTLVCVPPPPSPRVCAPLRGGPRAAARALR